MSNETTALAVLEGGGTETPTALMRRATDVANVAREIVLRTAIELKGKRYVKVESWQTIATLYGCTPSIREVVEEERGIKAVAELKRISDGAVIAAAEGYCGLDEATWANRPLYARRGMAQTRAISRVCRSAFAFVVTMIDEKLETTPAEEIPGAGDVIDVVAKPVPTSTASAAPPTGAVIPYGKNKGKRLDDPAVDDSYIEWLLGAATKSAQADDPKWGKQNKEFLAAVQAEAARRINATGNVRAPAEASPKVAKQAQLDVVDEEIVLPFAKFAALAREHGMTQAQLASRAKGVLGKASGFTHEDIETLRASIEAIR